MKRLILRLFMVMLSVYLVGAVISLYASEGHHAPVPSAPPPPTPPPAAPTPPAPVPSRQTPSPTGPPQLARTNFPTSTTGSGCGGGCGGQTFPPTPPPPTPPPVGEIASTDKGPVILPPDDSPYKGPPLPPPPGYEDKKTDGDKKGKNGDKKKQEALDGMTSGLAADLQSGDVSDEALTQKVNRIQAVLSLNPNLKLSSEFTRDLNQYNQNLKNQREADRKEYEIYHNTIIKLNNLTKDAKKQAITDITGTMVGEISKVNVGYGPLGIPFTAAEQMRRTRNAEVVANDFKNITNLSEARKKASYLRESMSLRVKAIDKRLKILQPLMK